MPIGVLSTSATISVFDRLFGLNDATAPARTPLPDAAAELISVLGPLQRALRRRAREDWPLEPLPTAQVELMRTVRARAGISVGEAAAELHVAPNTASTLANQLAGRGLLTREPDPRDGRSVRLVLTPAAERRVAARHDRRQQVLEAALAGLATRDQAAVTAALPALRQLVEGLLE
jgi:DNA-binding MarR family transcriptional regulator